MAAIFDSNKSIDKQAKQFPKKMNGILHQCFKKIKIKEDAIKEEDELYKIQKELKNDESKESKEKLRQVEERLIKLKSDDLHNIVLKRSKR